MISCITRQTFKLFTNGTTTKIAATVCLVASTAREVGQFLGGARRTVEEAKSDLIPEEVKEAQDAIQDLKAEALYGVRREKRQRKR